MGSISELPAIAKRLAGKVALITGGASGIGECTTRLFCRHGAKVVVADVQDKLGASVCTKLGTDVASFIHCDVTNEDDVSKAVDHAVQRFGQLDIMYNNAGITGPAVASRDYKKSDFQRVLDVNLVGPFLGTKHAARVMIPACRGCIISTASNASVESGSASHAYTCSKHGVVGLTRNSAFELGRYGIRVNCISPTGVATPLATGYTGMSVEQLEMVVAEVSKLKGVVLKVEDVANAVLFLASDESRYVSGQNLVIDGAYSVGNGDTDVFKETVI